MQKRVDILFPIEIVNRELDYRLFLACMCARHTNRVYIGQHDAIYRLAKHIRGGIYVGKNIFREEWPLAKFDRYNTIKANGFIFIHLDEEGGIFPGGKDEWKKCLDKRLDPRCLSPEDSMCVWGDFQRDYYSSLKPKCAGNIHTTGYPKFDLYKFYYADYYKETAQYIKRLHGDFILFNTSFPYANSNLGLSGIFSERLGSNVKDDAARVGHIKSWAYGNKVYAEFIELINYISIKFPDLKLIVRPHPCENQESYKTIFKGMGNIHVLHEYSVVPWLQVCKVMIHNGSTTAIEAYFLGAKIINFQPVKDPEVSYALPNLIGAECNSRDQVEAKINAMLRLDTNAFNFSLDPAIGNLMNNFNSDDGLAKFMQIILMAEGTLSAAGSRHDYINYSIGEALQNSYDGLKNIVRPLFKEKAKKYKYFVSPQMFSPFNPADILSRVRKIENILGVKIKIKFYGKEIFSLQLK